VFHTDSRVWLFNLPLDLVHIYNKIVTAPNFPLLCPLPTPRFVGSLPMQQDGPDVTRPPADLTPPGRRPAARPTTSSSSTLEADLLPTSSPSLTSRSSNLAAKQQDQLPIVDQDQRQATSQHKRITR
jgi:hypothetical protein